MTAREYLQNELRELEHLDRNLTREEEARVITLARKLRQCICRKCKGQYDSEKSRADYKGYCSMKCQHAAAKEHGFRKGGRSEYSVLQDAGLVGDITVI